MVVCKFYEQGNCRYGNNCRFEHPRGQSNNRFAAFGGNSGGGFNRGGNDTLPYMLSKETIEKDLTSEQPQWILSAYGPGRDAPEQLFGGPMREQSFEEMRLHHAMATASGNPQQALNQAQELYQQAQQQMKTAVGNLDGAIQFLISAEQKHPNRVDICKQGTLPGGTTGEFAVGRRATGSLGQANPFGSGGSSGASANPFSSGGQQPSAFGSGPSTTGSAFGQASALGQKPNAFGGGAAPAFGQPSQPTSAFGQASSAPAFGQPSQPTSAFGSGAQSSTSAFGQPSQPSSAFGQPSALGGGASAFGQASALGQKPNPFGSGGAFGQPAQSSGTSTSAFGQTSQPAASGSAFGQPSQPGTSGSAFGQPSQPGASGSAFGQPSALGGTGSGFGQASALGQKANPFGGGGAFGGGSGNTTSASPFGQAPSTNNSASSPFGQPAQNATQNASPFGAPSQPAQSAFGQPSQPGASASPFGQPSQTSQPAAANPFGQPSQTPAASNPFGAKQDAPASGGMDAQPTQPTSAFGQPSQPQAAANPFGQAKPAFGQPTGLGGAAQANPFGAQPAAPVAQQQAAPGSGPYPPGSSKQHPPVSSYSSKGMDGRLSMFKGKPVVYQNNLPGVRALDGGWKRVWFPDGPPNYYKDTELPDESYDEKSKLQWQAFARTGQFEGGLMPELPPQREFCLWDI
ncbi:ccch zinc finger domain protein [Colletotrichum kahawae]|uniref:Ccch zinc finger domain protein n=1 Tax=Colletotrichum kahawae TaxID=34407 RepID=A0AAD9YM42_COLKA|nr:ccch zinc finger domain protein [Colletotrichum kahawae]